MTAIAANVAHVDVALMAIMHCYRCTNRSVPASHCGVICGPKPNLIVHVDGPTVHAQHSAGTTMQAV